MNVPASSNANSLVHDPAYGALKQYLIETTGLAYYSDKDNDLAYRVGTRLAQLNLESCAAYLELLRGSGAHGGGSAERHRLIADLTIGETFFFRHNEQFDALRDLVLPDILERNRAVRTLRIWSAGCAIGAEPYSIAILLKQHFADRLAGWDVRILGTDINQAFLARAERGQFEEWALRSVSEDFKREWFEPSGRSYILVPKAREWVSFQYHNLVEHPYPSLIHGIAALDLILCRNVMIYFHGEVIRKILDQFHACLSEGGWLAVGHAESNPEAFRAYETVSVPGATLYRRNSRTVPIAPVGPAVWSAPVQGSTPQSTLAALASWTPLALPDFSRPARANAEGANKAGSPAASVPPVSLPMATPEDASPLALVRRLADEGRWDDAIRGCEKLIEEDRLNPGVHFCHAMILEQMGRPSDAEKGLRRAIYLDRGAALAHYHLALLLKKSGQSAEAIQSLNNVRGLLARMDRNRPIPNAEGLTAEELDGLAEMQLGLLKRS